MALRHDDSTINIVAVIIIIIIIICQLEMVGLRAGSTEEMVGSVCERKKETYSKWPGE